MPFHDLPPPPLMELLASAGPYRAAFAESLRGIDAALPERLYELDLLDPTRAERALVCVLSYACEAQNTANHELGRAAVLAMPREWVVPRIVSVARSTLDLRDEWELRRFLELLSVLDVGLLRGLASEVLLDPDDDLREAAKDMLRTDDAG